MCAVCLSVQSNFIFSAIAQSRARVCERVRTCVRKQQQWPSTDSKAELDSGLASTRGARFWWATRKQDKLAEK